MEGDGNADNKDVENEDDGDWMGWGLSWWMIWGVMLELS